MNTQSNIVIEIWRETANSWGVNARTTDGTWLPHDDLFYSYVKARDYAWKLRDQLGARGVLDREDENASADAADAYYSRRLGF